MGQRGFDAEQHTLEVRRKHVVPGALAHLLQLYWWENASVCTENVYPAKFGGYRRHDLFHIPLLLDVPSTEYCGAAAASQGLHRRGSVSFVPSKHTDPGAELGEDPSDALANALVPPVTMTDLFLIDVSTESSLFIRSPSVSGGLFSCGFTARLSNHCHCRKRA